MVVLDTVLKLLTCPEMKVLRMEFSWLRAGWGVISRNVVPMRLGNRQVIGGNSVGGVLQDPRRCRMTYKLPSFWFVPVIIGRLRKSPLMTFLAGYSSITEPRGPLQVVHGGKPPEVS